MINCEPLFRFLVCPGCHQPLIQTGEGFSCGQCWSCFGVNRYGYLELIEGEAVHHIDATTEEYAALQASSSTRFYGEYLKPYLVREPFERVLDVGCGLGGAVSLMAEDGFDAYGVDIPSLAKFWVRAGNDPRRFLCCDAVRLPYAEGTFDVVLSLGVIEHIGTLIGHCTLADNYKEARQQYADELLRVTRPGGRVLISCPNKSFPIDIQHGPEDDLSVKKPFRSFIYKKAKINLHPTWGQNHLLSYAEVESLFCKKGGARYMEPMPLKGYFGYSQLRTGFLRHLAKVAAFYVEYLPAMVRSTFFNPYMLAQIRK
jgi:SAM-dependent methyltransferase